MPNPVDENRLADTQRGGKVVDINAYREQAGTRSTAKPIETNAQQNGIFFVALIVLACLMFFGMFRAA